MVVRAHVWIEGRVQGVSFRAYTQFNCEGEAADYCYPLNFYRPEFEDDWEGFGLQPPAYFGQTGETLVDLGQFGAEDPRFAECTARRFHAYLTQGELLDTPVSVISPLQQQLHEPPPEESATAGDQRGLARDAEIHA